MKSIFRLFILLGFILVIPSLRSFSQTIYIGANYGGGIVFYLTIDATGYHGLIAAPGDQSAGAPWGCSGTLIGTGTAFGTGQVNTTAIMTNCGTPGIAAQICDALVLGDYSDWFLPSKDELNQMYLQKSVIGGFTDNWYWCSSEADAAYAWCQYFINGDNNYVGQKYDNFISTRAIRAFNCMISNPAAGTNIPAGTQIIWNWNTVSGATGYKWNTTNDYTSATDMGNSTTKTETGLTPDTTYTRFVWAYNNCGNSIVTTLIQSTLSLYIGANYGGGIVFYIDGTHQHGLIAAPNDQSTGAQWGCLGTLIGTGTAIGSGQTNTTAIVNNGCSTAGIAAQICDNLGLDGYNDWFLPSQDELNQMYIQKPVIGNFASGYYWSSSEDCPDGARAQSFSSGAHEGCSRNSAYYVRAIRTVCIKPVTPTAGIQIPALFQIIWNWNTVSNATGYKWNTINDYTSATDMGNSTTKTETGLIPSTTYARFVWAYNNCGYLPAQILVQTTLSFFIGENYGGGIIFYIDLTGLHGLIAAPNDLRPGGAWGCYGTLIGGTGTAIGTGQANTTAIINGCSDAGIAARLCRNYNGGGYSDWFLPSRDELNQMYIQKTVIGGFWPTEYWSSSEIYADGAWVQYFPDGGQFDSNKASTFYLRAVRAF